MSKDLNQLLRPSTWDQVIGQQDVKDVILNAIEANTFPKFSIFAGPSGTGKSCVAELTAKTLLCKSEDNKPCGTCSECSKKSNPAIIKYNMGALLGKKDIVEILETIFKYETMSEKTIYILEEVQVLKQREEQTPFLEELTKIPDDVYIMMCTTQVSKLLPALRSRATTFYLDKPDKFECIEYIQDILERLGCKPMDEWNMRTLAAISEYTPRNIVKNIELLMKDGEISTDLMNKFFKVISKETYIDIFSFILDYNCSTQAYVRYLDKIGKDAKYSKLLYGIKDIALTILLEMSIGSVEPVFSVSERHRLQKILKDTEEKNFMKLVSRLGDVDGKTFNSERDCLFELIKIKMFMEDLRMSTVITNNRKFASAETAENSQNARLALAKRTMDTDDSVKNITDSADIESVIGIAGEVFGEDDI